MSLRDNNIWCVLLAYLVEQVSLQRMMHCLPTHCCLCLQEDNNPGTYPLQSERFYSALKGHGGRVRLVLLPHEGHGYRARESVLHTLYEQVTPS
jgi:hypothetical protein